MTSEVSAKLLDTLMKISPLRHENSQEWFIRAEDYFAYEDLINYLQEHQPATPLNRSKDKKMLAILKTLVDDSMSTQLGQFNIAASAWSYLKSYYENKIDKDDFYWLNKIENFQLQEEKNLLINFEQLTVMFNSLKKIETLEDYKLVKFCSKLNQHRYNGLLNNHLLKATNEENFRNHLAHYDNQSNDNGRNQRRDEQHRRESSSASGDQNDRRCNYNQLRNQPARADNRSENYMLNRGPNKEYLINSGIQNKEYSRSDHHNDSKPANRTSNDYSRSNNLNSSRSHSVSQDQFKSRKPGSPPRRPTDKGCARLPKDDIFDEFRASSDREIVKRPRARNLEDGIIDEFSGRNREGERGGSTRPNTSISTERKKQADKGRTRTAEDHIFDEFRTLSREVNKSRARNPEDDIFDEFCAPNRQGNKSRARDREDDILDEFMCKGNSRASNRSAPEKPSVAAARTESGKLDIKKAALGSDWGSSDEDTRHPTSINISPVVVRTAVKAINPFLDDGEDHDESKSPSKQDDRSPPKTRDSPRKSTGNQEKNSVFNGKISPSDWPVDYNERYRKIQSDDDDSDW